MTPGADSSAAPAGGPSAPLDYEQSHIEAFTGVFRSGDNLVVAIGSDLSQYCIHCGRPTAGKPVVLQYVPQDNRVEVAGGTAIDHPVGCLLSAITAGFAMNDARREAQGKTVAVGLCELHRRKERRVLRGAALTFVLGVGLFIGGLAWRIAQVRADGHVTNDFATMMMIAGPIVAFVFSLLVVTRLRRPKIVAAANGQCVLTGVGAAVLKAQPALPIAFAPMQS